MSRVLLAQDGRQRRGRLGAVLGRSVSFVSVGEMGMGWEIIMGDSGCRGVEGEVIGWSEGRPYRSVLRREISARGR